jgi:serine/threonine-protein kinase
MSLKDFHNTCRIAWVKAISSAVGPTPPATTTWRGRREIVGAMTPFVEAMNHLLLPGTGGGNDVAQVTLGREPGTIEFVVRDDKTYIVKPKSMTLEYVAAAPAESFVTVDLATLLPTGVDPRPSSDDQWNEELAELSARNYVERNVWDQRYIGHDAAGDEISLPKKARLVMRIFGGRLMLVSKGSLWNSVPATYDGLHDRMTNREIRDLIERSIPSAKTA